MPAPADTRTETEAMSSQEKCCGKYRKKAKACKGCPLMAMLAAAARERRRAKGKKKAA